jgi:regulator of protease activity HflC (stomatin/prohibitin superfamily)
MVVCAFAGAFFSGQSRVSVFRYLKAVGAYLYVAFGVMLLACVGELTKNYHVLDWYENSARMVVFIVSAILGVELIINFIIEFYRPRTMSENRPIFESKLLSIFTEPGGVMRNIAETLDYQFGWKVSGTWIYSFIEKALFPLIIVWVLILWGFTTIHAVKIGELGVREEFGKVLSRDLLEPGIYFTKPWPFGKIRVFSNKEIKQIFIGHNPNEEHEEEEEEVDDGHGHSHGEKKEKAPEGPRLVVTWTEAHTHGDTEEGYFLLPSQSSHDLKDKSTTAVDLLAFSIPIQYRVRPDGIFDYAYLNSNPDATLQKLSEEVVINYLASATLRDFIAVKRTEAENVIMKKIQAKADEAKLGIELVSVNLTEVHPPMTNNTSAAFHEDRIAQEQASAAILNAKIYSGTILPGAEIRALQITEEALSYSDATKKIAVAESSRFETQLKTFKVMPQMFMLNSYLAFLEQDCKDIRKFVLSNAFKDAVFEMNFEEKGALDLIDMDLNALGQGN